MATLNGNLNAPASSTEPGVTANASSTRCAIVGYAAAGSNIPAVQGHGSVGNGLYATSSMPFGGAVAGVSNASNGYGVYGAGPTGVYAESAASAGIGVSGRSTAGNGIGVAASGFHGLNATSTAANGSAIEATQGSGSHAGRFTGPVLITGPLAVTGFISKPGGGFVIDHPLDPTRQLLEHSFVESPERKNIYDGIVTADENGEATIELPAYFDALNTDFRYQAMALGSPAHLFVKEELKAGRFTLAGASPNQRLSWQVTGIRKDMWAQANPVMVERPKESKP